MSPWQTWFLNKCTCLFSGHLKKNILKVCGNCFWTYNYFIRSISVLPLDKQDTGYPRANGYSEQRPVGSLGKWKVTVVLLGHDIIVEAYSGNFLSREVRGNHNSKSSLSQSLVRVKADISVLSVPWQPDHLYLSPRLLNMCTAKFWLSPKLPR